MDEGVVAGRLRLQRVKKYIPILFFLPVFYVFICLILSRTQYQTAGLGIANGVYKNMYPYLTRAMELLPIQTAPFLCQADLQRIHTGLGKLGYERARRIPFNALDRYVELEQAHAHYEKALAINPNDILAVRGTAETVAALEFTYARLFPGRRNKYNALPMFKRVLALEPNGLDSNYSTAGYFYTKGLQDELFIQVRHCAKIYPTYGKLKKEPFFNSTEAREAVRVGLEQAISANIMVQSAYFSLSKYWEVEKRYSEAAVYYKKALTLSRKEIPSKKYLHFGRLLLEAGNNKQAYAAFIEALKGKTTFTKYVRSIYSVFKQQNDLAGFMEFAKLARTKQISSDQLELSIARAQITLNLFEPAKDTLRKINAKDPNPLAYFMLAKLAKKEKDWDCMELSIQKATVLDPHNGRYFNMLTDALLYQKKYKPAAYYMQRALANDPENPKYRKKLNKIRSYHD